MTRSRRKERRVVISGIGMISSLGNDRIQTWDQVVHARSGAQAIRQFDASDWQTSFACEITTPSEDSAESPLINRPNRFGLQAAKEALLDSGLDLSTGERKDTWGISVGCGLGTISPHMLAKVLSGLSLVDGLPGVGERVERERDPILLPNHPGALGAHLAQEFRLHGPTTTFQSACSASAQAVGHAYRQIVRGECDAVLAGGADCLSGELILAGFSLLGALSQRNEDPQRACRPFDRDRDGFVAGEGSAMLVLEERERALERGAPIYCEVTGYGETQSAYRITDLPPNGRGITEAMQQAIEDAECDLRRIRYVNAHGTATEVNDRVEALAIRRVFGSRGHHPYISSTKAQVGHMVAAAGAIEAGFCALAIRDGVIPPTLNLEETDCGTDLNFLAHAATHIEVDAALSNSIGFGGTNTSLLMEAAS